MPMDGIAGNRKREEHMIEATLEEWNGMRMPKVSERVEGVIVCLSESDWRDVHDAFTHTPGEVIIFHRLYNGRFLAADRRLTETEVKDVMDEFCLQVL
jgi:hypothetical protein